MGKYDHLSKEELIQRIERLEADLEKAVAQAPKSLRHAESAVFDVEDADEE